MKNLSVLFCAVGAVAMAATVSAETPSISPQQAIGQALDASAAAWSAGDLKTFMELYERAPNTRYVSAKGVVEGYDAIEAMYASRFKTPGASGMGKLTLEVIDVKLLGSQYAFVIGRYHLKPETGDTVSGLTTLLFHKVGTRWLISADHSS
ncbi:uncharacterized protein (TIGR02246 family) [Luteibacter rhizovicinus]|uniref:Uncharacterized protein (TIGR02246 family) n=1 Tax=Luteibacter rhizovicinus TaxID=242606 RepID=A0A4R3YM64_9GAMM|nr:SgcJ/EcaC family oxidoreductase [Luteibacter rhizovicinus]TCV93396.1 uncharacterized protein (TIGR02246 family) [Luteibacter rhizovicinus]